MDGAGGARGGTCMLGPRTLAWSSVRYCRVFAGPLSRAVLFCRICGRGRISFGSLRVWTRGVEYSALEACHSWPRSLVRIVQMTPEGVWALSICIRSRQSIGGASTLVPELTLPNNVAGKPANDTTDVTTRSPI